jgi:hypothetical protein
MNGNIFHASLLSMKWSDMLHEMLELHRTVSSMKKEIPGKHFLLYISDDDKLTSNCSMNLEPLRTLHSHYLDILATVVSKIHTTQSIKRLKDIFSLTPIIKKLSMRLQLQITSYDVEQIPNEG